MSARDAMQTVLSPDLIELIAEEIEVTAAANMANAANKARGFQIRQPLKQKVQSDTATAAKFQAKFQAPRTHTTNKTRNWMS
jgi:hypothetical protein